MPTERLPHPGLRGQHGVTEAAVCRVPMLLKICTTLDCMWLSALCRRTITWMLLTAGFPFLRERHALVAGGPGRDAQRGGRCRARRQRPCQRASLYPAPLREHHTHHTGERSQASRAQVHPGCWVTLAYTPCHAQITLFNTVQPSPGRRLCVSSSQLLGQLGETVAAGWVDMLTQSAPDRCRPAPWPAQRATCALQR